MLGALLSDNTLQRFKFISFPRQKPQLTLMKYYHYLFAILILGAISCSKKDVEENNSAQSTTQTQASTDAEPEPKSENDSNSTAEPNEPTEDENNDSGKHSEVAKSLSQVMNRFADTLSTVRDAESAETAVAKFDEIANDIEKIYNQMESLGLPTGQEAEAVKVIISNSEKEISEKMSGISDFLLGDKEVGEIITLGITNFRKRIEKITPLMEQWADNSSQSSKPGEAPVNEIPLEEAVEKIDE
mgnify:FL=1